MSEGYIFKRGRGEKVQCKMRHLLGHDSNL